MRNLIKIFFALGVILGSYYLGYYQANEKYSSQLKEVNEKLSIRQSTIRHLKDSILTIIKVTNQNTSNFNNSLKGGPKSSSPKNTPIKK